MTDDRHARVKEIFLAATDLPPDEREAFLDTECAEDPSLCAETE